MSCVLEVSENSYFNWRKRGVSQRKQDDKQLSERIEEAFHDNREVYGSPRIHAELVKKALQMALLQRDPGAALVHHSDRGSEYASKSYQEMLHQRGIQVSMSRKGDCYDNAMIESFWGTLKEEEIGQKIYLTREEAKTALFEYTEVFYVRSVQPKRAFTCEGMADKGIALDNS